MITLTKLLGLVSIGMLAMVIADILTRSILNRKPLEAPVEMTLRR